jgi:hypothetical protein
MGFFGGMFDSIFDFDGNGKLSDFEKAVMFDALFGDSDEPGDENSDDYFNEYGDDFSDGGSDFDF